MSPRPTRSRPSPATTMAAAARAGRRGDAGRVGDGRTAASSRPPPSTSWPKSAAEHPEATLVAGATDVGLWVTKQHARHRPGDLSRPRAELQQIEETGDAIDDRRRGQPTPTPWRRWPRCYPDIGELMRRFGGGADPQCRHDRRQHRQRLADRRPPAGADRARRDAAPAPRRRAARACRSRILHRLRQAGPAARRVRRAVTCRSLRRGAPFRGYKISKRFDQDISAVAARSGCGSTGRA